MSLYVQKKNSAKANAASQRKGNGNSLPLQDNRAKSIIQKKQLDKLKTDGDNEGIIQKKENNTGLPGSLKAGVETLSGISMNDVKVHYNSAKPAQLNAYAYAQGNNIHIAPGQEKHLPHEAWHVVQQKKGRVRPTLQMKLGVAVNDDKGLEKEADIMGSKAAALSPGEKDVAQPKKIENSTAVFNNQPVQLFGDGFKAFAYKYPWITAIGFVAAAAIATWAVTRKKETLDGLPEDLWWKLFIDIKDHPAALALKDPGMLYDSQQSKGHKKNMMSAFKAELLGSGGKLGTVVDLAEYERLHNLVTANLDNKEDVQKWSSGDFGEVGDNHPPVSFPIEGKGAPAADVLQEQVAGMHLMMLQAEGIDLDAQAITLFHGGRITVNYTTGKAGAFVSFVLNRYYAQKNAHNADDKLRAIARAIRALHVIHAFRDANGRLHVMLMLNKFLKEEGFSPVVLPNGPAVFGGSYTIDELVAELKAGQTNFGQLAAPAQ